MLHDVMQITSPYAVKDLLWAWVKFHEGGVRPSSLYQNGKVYMRFGDA